MRLIVADDSLLLREGISRLLVEAGFQVVGLASTGEEALAQVEQHKPDVAIVDIRMPPTHSDEGLKAAQQIRARHPDVGVLVLSQYVELGLAARLLAENAAGMGYLLKDRITDLDEFAASALADPPSIRPSSRNCWGDAGTTTCSSTSLLRA